MFDELDDINARDEEIHSDRFNEPTFETSKSAEQKIEALEAIELNRPIYQNPPPPPPKRPLFPTILDHGLYVSINNNKVLVSPNGTKWKESKSQRYFGSVNFTPEVLDFIDKELN